MKPIKFNLSYGNERIKTVAELKESCNIDMLLETLENGLLVRWLAAQSEVELSEKIAKIDKSDYKKALPELLTILFDKEASFIEQASAELFSVREKEAVRLENLKNLAAKENEIITQYHAGYENVLELLKENSEDYALLKAQMTVLYMQYPKLLELDKTHFYETFKTGYPLVLLAFMANSQLRELIGYDSGILYQDVIKDIPKSTRTPTDLNSVRDELQNGEVGRAFCIENDEQLRKFKNKYGNTLFGFFYKKNGNFIKRISKASAFCVGAYYVPLDEIKTPLPEIKIPHVKKFSGKTDSYWKDIEPCGKQFMIIKMEEGNNIRNAGVTSEEMTATDINGKFIFTDGIDYMSNSDSDELIYMEV